jgi:hypothetical protein
MFTDADSDDASDCSDSDDDERGNYVVVKPIGSASREHGVIQQLLGQKPRLGSQPSECVRLWETLHLAPLVDDGLVTIADDADVVAVVMKKLVPLAELPFDTVDVRVLLRVASQLVEVRR